MTQWLIEEAAFFALEASEMKERSRDDEAERLFERHAELTAMKEKSRGLR